MILHGSEDSLALKERLMLELSRDPVMQLKDVHDLSKDELRERTMEKIAEMRHYVKREDAKTFARRCQTVGLSDAGFQTRFGVSTGLFLGAIRNGSTKEQWGEFRASFFASRPAVTLTAVSTRRRRLLGGQRRPPDA